MANEHIQAYMAGQFWAVQPEWLLMMRDIARGYGDPQVVKQARADRAELKGSYGVFASDEPRVVSGVAVVPVHGTLMRYGNMLSEVSGATSQSVLRQQLMQAEASDDVHTVVLEFDTPGGEVNGVLETAALIKAMSKRTVAYVADKALSGGFWLASQADEIVGHELSMVGSIGAVVSLQKEDPDGIVLVSEVSPNKVLDLDDDDSVAQVQGSLNRIGEVFVNAVADGLGMEPSEVVAAFNNGGVIMGTDAKAAGGLNRLATFSELLESEMNDRVQTDQVTVEWLQENRPEVLSGIQQQAQAAATSGVDSAVAEAVTAERQRIAGIRALSIPGHEALIETACADPAQNAGTVAQAIVVAEQAARRAASDGVVDTPSAPAATQQGSTARVDQDGGDQGTPQTREGWMAQWAASPKLQAEFLSAAGYASYMEANSKGLVRLLRTA